MPEEEIGPEAVRPTGSETWHLSEAEDPVTLCGLVIQYGARRRLWARTPADERCQICLQRLRFPQYHVLVRVGIGGQTVPRRAPADTTLKPVNWDFV